MRAYLSQYRYGIAYPQDLVALAEQVSGYDLDPLYKQWIVGLDDQGHDRNTGPFCRPFHCIL